MAEPAKVHTFSSILDRKGTDIKRPPPMPVGTYVWVVKGLPRFDKSSKKQTDFVEFNVVALQALDDVDPGDLEAMGGVVDKTTTITFYLTEKSAYRLTEFMHDDLGIDDDQETRAMIDQTPGKQFLGHVKHVPSSDGKGVYWEIDQTAPLES
jgi:uncharacterized iron-regulated membrane protein